MKILVISDCPIYPTTAGNRRFILDQIQLFREMGHDVSYIYIKRNQGCEEDVEKMKIFLGEKDFFLYEPGFIFKIYRYLLHKWKLIFKIDIQKVDELYPFNFHSYVKQIQKKNNYDCCVINYYFLSKLFEKVHFSLEAINTHDYFSYKNLLIGKSNTWLNTTADQEAKAMQRCKNIFALNREESVYFSKLSPRSHVYNVFSIFQYKQNKIVGNKDILFLSGPNVFNIEGIHWFVDNIFPKIVNRFPEVRLIIGGGICEELVDFQNKPHIVLFGIVENQEYFYSLADIAINPTFQGTGLKIKTFEAIAFDKVVMAHPHSKTGIYSEEQAPIFDSFDANSWVAFLINMWGTKENIKDWKCRNKHYINEMSDYVRNEYRNFFSCK